MKRAAIERQAQKAAEASKQPSKRDPGYDAVTRRKLKKAGFDARSEQPQSVLDALANIPDAQTERITAMRYQDAPSRDHKSERAAIVCQVHSAMIGLTEEAQSGWLDYAELWESAQQTVTASYSEQVTGGKTGTRDENRDPAWLEAATELRMFHKRLDPRVARRAEEFMRVKEGLAVNAITLSMLEKVGLHLANAFAENE
jgi:hypothetical protein